MRKVLTVAPPLQMAPPLPGDLTFALRHETLRTLLLRAGFGMLGGLNGLVFWAILRPDRKAGA